MVTTLSLPGWRPRSSRRGAASGESAGGASKRLSAGMFSTWTPGHQGWSVRGRGVTGSRGCWDTARSRGEPEPRELVLLSARLPPCLSLITAPLSGAITSQFWRGSFGDLREIKATDTKSGHLLEVKQEVLGLHRIKLGLVLPL